MGQLWTAYPSFEAHQPEACPPSAGILFKYTINTVYPELVWTSYAEARRLPLARMRDTEAKRTVHKNSKWPMSLPVQLPVQFLCYCCPSPAPEWLSTE